MMIRDNFYGDRDAYSNFDFNEANVDMQSWGSDHPILSWVVDKLRPKLSIEVGSWKGRSAINMVKKMASSDINGEILCFDT